MEAEKAMISATFFDGGREGAALRKNNGMKNQCPAQRAGHAMEMYRRQPMPFYR